jgi:hypothetical protein
MKRVRGHPFLFGDCMGGWIRKAEPEKCAAFQTGEPGQEPLILSLPKD